jgi:hypothetical protein
LMFLQLSFFVNTAALVFCVLSPHSGFTFLICLKSLIVNIVQCRKLPWLIWKVPS